MAERDLARAALRGEPSYVWRAGQERRLQMILAAAGERIRGRVLENGCGIGLYLQRLAQNGGQLVGLEYDFERARQARPAARPPSTPPVPSTAPAMPFAAVAVPFTAVVQAAGEALPFPTGAFDFILSHEVLEHVQDDLAAIREMVRTLAIGGRLAIFVPNRGYPFETHGIYWRGRYHFGNIPLVNYLPRRWRDRLAPHVRVYSRHDLQRLFAGLPVRFVESTVIFGAYDNIIARRPGLGGQLRAVLQSLEKTPLRTLGLSHFWVIEKT